MVLILLFYLIGGVAGDVRGFAFVSHPAIISDMSLWAVHFVGIMMAVAIIWALWRILKIPRHGVRIPLQMALFLLGLVALEWYVEHVKDTGISSPGSVGWTIVILGASVVYLFIFWLSTSRGDSSKIKKE